MDCNLSVSDLQEGSFTINVKSNRQPLTLNKLYKYVLAPRVILRLNIEHVADITWVLYV